MLLWSLSFTFSRLFSQNQTKQEVHNLNPCSVYIVRQFTTHIDIRNNKSNEIIEEVLLKNADSE